MNAILLALVVAAATQAEYDAELIVECGNLENACIHRCTVENETGSSEFDTCVEACSAAADHCRTDTVQE